MAARAAAALPSLGGALTAQLVGHDPAALPQHTAAMPVRQVPALQARDGDLLGVGANYTVQFGSEGPTFIPALGNPAPRPMPVRLNTLSVGRGGDPVPVTAPIRSHTGRTVTYHRGRLAETYELRDAGLKQSYVFDALPPGQGDLVVRVGIDTELLPGDATDAGLCWSWPNVGGVSIEGVLGIDARGRQAVGSLARCREGFELRLPGEFVSTAALPLVLDPLIGTAWQLGFGNVDQNADLAWDASNTRWLVVWAIIVAANVSEVRGQFLDTNGAPLGGLFAIATASAMPRGLAIANINGANGFVVAYERNGDVFARGVRANDGALSPEVALADGNVDQHSVVLSGEALDFASGQALAVWATGFGQIDARTINYDGVTLTLGATQRVAGGLASEPTVSRSGGAAGRHLIAWVSRSPTGGPDVIVAQRWQRGGTLIPGAATASEATATSSPAVDGDGIDWVLTYGMRPAVGTARSLRARPLRDSGSVIRVGPAQSVGGRPDQTLPSVGWQDHSVLVAWQQQASSFGGPYDTLARSVDPFTCTDCEDATALGVDADNESNARVATKASSGAFRNRDAAIVWSRANRIMFQRWQAQHGAYTSLGGGCGQGGEARATCALAGNANFTIRLRGGPSNTPVFGILGFQRLDYTCGSCTLIPDPFSGIVLTQTADFNGDTAQAMPIPPGAVGGRFYLQYLSIGGRCLETSNAILVTVQD